MGEGWLPDPFERFELRYHDGDEWTAHVSTKGERAQDPPLDSSTEEYDRLKKRAEKAEQRRVKRKDSAAQRAQAAVRKALESMVGNITASAERAFADGSQLFQSRFLISSRGERSAYLVGKVPAALRYETKQAWSAYGWTAGVLDEIEAAGWRLEHVAAFSVPIGSDSRERLLGSGHTEQIASQEWGIYVFRRAPDHRLSPADRFAPLAGIELPGVKPEQAAKSGWPDWWVDNERPLLEEAGLVPAERPNRPRDSD